MQGWSEPCPCAKLQVHIMQNTSYVLVPYQEYQELLALKKEADLQAANQIFFQDIFSVCDLSIRTTNALINHFGRKIIYVGELVLLSERQFFKLANIGLKSLNEFRLALKNHDLYLGMKLDKNILSKLEELKHKTE